MKMSMYEYIMNDLKKSEEYALPKSKSILISNVIQYLLIEIVISYKKYSIILYTVTITTTTTTKLLLLYY